MQGRGTRLPQGVRHAEQVRIRGDFAKFINGLAGTVAGMSREAGESARERTREWIAGLDFVSRDEFEAVKEMAAKAREEADSLAARVARWKRRCRPGLRVGLSKAGLALLIHSF